jgi:L-aminopeptidase/D-esterase-like protein
MLPLLLQGLHDQDEAHQTKLCIGVCFSLHCGDCNMRIVEEVL